MYSRKNYCIAAYTYVVTKKHAGLGIQVVLPYFPSSELQLMYSIFIVVKNNRRIIAVTFISIPHMSTTTKNGCSSWCYLDSWTRGFQDTPNHRLASCPLFALGANLRLDVCCCPFLSVEQKAQ